MHRLTAPEICDTKAWALILPNAVKITQLSLCDIRQSCLALHLCAMTNAVLQMLQMQLQASYVSQKPCMLCMSYKSICGECAIYDSRCSLSTIHKSYAAHSCCQQHVLEYVKKKWLGELVLQHCCCRGTTSDRNWPRRCTGLPCHAAQQPSYYVRTHTPACHSYGHAMPSVILDCGLCLSLPCSQSNVGSAHTCCQTCSHAVTSVATCVGSAICHYMFVVDVLTKHCLSGYFIS